METTTMNTIENRKLEDGAVLSDADLDAASGGMRLSDPTTLANTLAGGAIVGGLVLGGALGGGPVAALGMGAFVAAGCAYAKYQADHDR
jgi:hypothetical protein